MASLRERLTAAHYDYVRAVVTALADEFDVMDIAAAMKMAHGARLDPLWASAPPTKGEAARRR